MDAFKTVWTQSIQTLNLTKPEIEPGFKISCDVYGYGYWLFTPINPRLIRQADKGRGLNACDFSAIELHDFFIDTQHSH